MFSYAPTFINRQMSLDENNIKSKMGIKESQRRQGSLKIMGFLLANLQILGTLLTLDPMWRRISLMDNLVCRQKMARVLINKKCKRNYFCKDNTDEQALWSLYSSFSFLTHYCPYPLQMDFKAPAESLSITDDVTTGRSLQCSCLLAVVNCRQLYSM